MKFRVYEAVHRFGFHMFQPSPIYGPQTFLCQVGIGLALQLLAIVRQLLEWLCQHDLYQANIKLVLPSCDASVLSCLQLQLSVHDPYEVHLLR